MATVEGSDGEVTVSLHDKIFTCFVFDLHRL